MNREQFNLAVQAARPGDKTVYARGYLPQLKEASKDARKVARAALEAFALGQVELVQKRLGDFRYQYIAIKKAVPRIPAHFTMPREQVVVA